MMGFSVWCFDWENDFHFFFGYAYMIHMECNNVTYQVAVSFSSESLHPNIYTQIL